MGHHGTIVSMYSTLINRVYISNHPDLFEFIYTLYTQNLLRIQMQS